MWPDELWNSHRTLCTSGSGTQSFPCRYILPWWSCISSGHGASVVCVRCQVCEKVSLLTYLSAHDSPITGVDCGEGGGWRSSCGVGLRWLPLFSLLALFLSACSAGVIWFQNLNGCKDVDGMAGVCCGPASCCGVESGDVGRDCV